MRQWATPGLAMLVGISERWDIWHGEWATLTKGGRENRTYNSAKREGGEGDSESAETLSAQNGGRWVSY